MNIFSLTGLIALLAVGVLIIASLIKKPENWLVAYLRHFVGTYFIFSGVVKAIDPTGLAIKMTDYFNIFTEYIAILTPLWEISADFALPIAIFMITLEIALGVSLILGTLVNSTLTLYLGLLVFFTFLTGFSSITGKVTDCGCFGDFVKLKPFESFLKDLFLLVLLFGLLAFKNQIKLLFNRKAALGALGGLTFFALLFCLRNYYNLPIVDFRAYKVGTNIIEGREDGDEGEIQLFYTLEKESTGESKVVSSDDYMSQKLWEDKSWTINKDKTEKKVIEEPTLPSVKDFFLYNEAGDEVTEDILNTAGYQFWVVSYDVDKSKKKGFLAINEVIRKIKQDNIPVVGITASTSEQASPLSEGLYEFVNLDATPIKTMIRANPGVVLIKDGVLVGKWHYGHVPSYEDLKTTFKW